jgi:hypothetical protein
MQTSWENTGQTNADPEFDAPADAKTDTQRMKTPRQLVVYRGRQVYTPAFARFEISLPAARGDARKSGWKTELGPDTCLRENKRAAHEKLRRQRCRRGIQGCCCRRVTSGGNAYNLPAV